MRKFKQKNIYYFFNYYIITEFENNNKNGLRAGHFYSIIDDVGILGSDARTSSAISTVFLQPPLYLLQSHSWFGYSNLLQRTNAADTSANKFFQGVYATIGEQWIDVLATTVSDEHRYINREKLTTCEIKF